MTESIRRHDIDALRVIAIGLLIVYHVAIGFQSWGIMIGFIAHDPAIDSLWLPMTALNVWRIPLLFFVSGMGVSFAFRKRTALQLLGERVRRILLPFAFGAVCVVPLHLFVLQGYYGWPLRYSPGPGHLWFLGNIFAYTLVLLPLFLVLHSASNGAAAGTLRRWVASPFGWLVIVAVFVAEAVALDPYFYEMYAMTLHGFVLGFLAFLCGYLFVYSGAAFWSRLARWRWFWLASAVALFAFRTLYSTPRPIPPMLSIESNAWVLAVLAFGYRHLNRPSGALRYLSEAAYPVYIIHMLFLYLASALVFPLSIHVAAKVIMVLALTFVGCFACYEYLIRRVRWLRPLFGLKANHKRVAGNEPWGS